jgi:ABC-type multidrug transport system ATPase subunit/ABC-type transporter Mla maintaining outer membrane lipid asymmetry permease subunit MlaE
MHAEIVVRLDDLWAGFKQHEGVHYVLRGASLSIRRGERICIVGPSGSGKSVLLNLLIGVLRPERNRFVMRGEAEILGEDILSTYPPALTRQIGIVFQESALFEDLSTQANAAFGLKTRGGNQKTTKERVNTLLRAVGLEDPPSKIHELSGGQKKRLALARTLAVEPEFLIYDEPTTGLDPQLCRQIADLISKTHEEGQGRRTTLVVTHDYEAVVPMADRVLLLDPRHGKIEEIAEVRDLDGRLEEIASEGRSRSRSFQKEGSPISLLLEEALTAPLHWLGPIARFLSHPWPGSWRQTVLRMADALVLPCLYTCAAGAVLGGLATFFTLENNPLKGAMDRQALIGLGKVLVAIVFPLMTAVLFAARVGAGAAARLGNIRLGRQDDALRMLGRDPSAYLITPLFWTCLVGLPLLTLPVCVAGSLASLFCTALARPITPFGWASAFLSELTLSDLCFALIKLVGSGGLVAAVAAWCGLKHKSGAEALGRDVTSAIVGATFFVILWQGLWTFIQYGP